jgi:hypothetical protein
MIAKLTARTVEGLKPTPGKRMDYHDTEVAGLTLRVTERGAKSWTVMYRHRGRLRRLTLGSATVIGLADARERARDAALRASKGADPAAEKRESRRAETMGDLATEYHHAARRADARRGHRGPRRPHHGQSDDGAPIEGVQVRVGRRAGSTRARRITRPAAEQKRDRVLTDDRNPRTLASV